MPSYTTVFLFTEKATSEIVLYLLTIAAALLAAGIGIYFVRNATRRKKTIDLRIFLPIIGGFGVALVQGTLFVLFLSVYLPLNKAYAQGQYQIIEGRVHVLSTQPTGGHASGDAILVGVTPYSIDYFSDSPGYTQTIAHQGVLTEDASVRIISVGGRILRLDLKQTP